MRVLVADDNQINREFIKGVLERERFLIAEAADGRAAVECCRAGAFDLILMDIRMPGMDGVAAAREIRALPGFEQGATTLIALTADLQLQQQTDLMQEGFDAVLLKPISRARLLETIEQTPGRRPARDRSGTARAPIDHDAALAAAGGSRDLVDRLTAMLVEETAQFLPRIETAIEAGDYAAAREMAHKTRGSAGYTGARVLQQTAAELELALTRRQRDEIDQALKHLRTAIAELNDYVKRRSGA